MNPFLQNAIAHLCHLHVNMFTNNSVIDTEPDNNKGEQRIFELFCLFSRKVTWYIYCISRKLDFEFLKDSINHIRSVSKDGESQKEAQ